MAYNFTTPLIFRKFAKQPKITIMAFKPADKIQDLQYFG